MKDNNSGIILYVCDTIPLLWEDLFTQSQKQTENEKTMNFLFWQQHNCDWQLINIILLLNTALFRHYLDII